MDALPLSHLYLAAEAQHRAWENLKKWLKPEGGDYLMDKRWQAVEDYYMSGYRLATAQVLSDIKNYGLDEVVASQNRFLDASAAKDEEQT